MLKTRPLVVALLLLAAACGGSEPTEPTVTVASITVSPSTATLSAPGATTQFSATVRGSDGSTMSTTVAWTSSNAAVASISSGGLATGVAAGTAAITATAGGKAGSAVVTVEAQTQGCASPETVSLSAGGSASYDASTCLLLPSGSSGDRYRLAVYRPTAVENASDVSTASLQVTCIGVSLSPPAPAPARVSVRRPAISGLSVTALERSMRIAAATERAHVAMRRQEVQLVADLGADALLRSRWAGPLRSIQRAASPAKMQIDPRTPSTCSAGTAETVTAVLIDENSDMAIYQDSVQNAATPVTAAQASRMLSYYAAYAKQMIIDYFGTPSDLDGNDKLVTFVTPTISGDIAAQVWSGDFFPQSECSPSNEMEVIYFNNDLIQAMDEDSPSFQALETLAHEAKHVVSLYHRIQATDRMGSSQYHPSWIEEGTAEIAGGMSSRIAWAATGGPAVGAVVTRDNFVATGITPENYGILLRMARTIWYLSSQPNSMVVKPTGADEGHSVYGSSWNFHRWLGDGYGNAATPMADATLFKQQNDSLTPGGAAGLTAVTQKTYEQLLEEYFIAVMLHGTGAPQPTRAITTYDFITATDVLVTQPNGSYPWPVTERNTQTGVTTPASFNSATYSGPIGNSGVRIHDFLSNGSGTGAQIEVSVIPPAKIVVVRIR